MEVSAGDVIALLALAFSLFTYWRQRKFDEQNRKLNALLIAREENESDAANRADLGARFVKHGKNSYTLNIFNRGQGDAVNVRMDVLEDDGIIMMSEVERKLPFPKLEPQSAIKILAAPCLGMDTRVLINLHWRDGRGEQMKELTVDL